jgi:hypothetical protein
MARPVSGPLTETDYQKLNAALHGLENEKQQIGMALQAGLDCAQEDQLCEDLRKRLAQIKATYFPMHP